MSRLVKCACGKLVKFGGGPSNPPGRCPTCGRPVSTPLATAGPPNSHQLSGTSRRTSPPPAAPAFSNGLLPAHAGAPVSPPVPPPREKLVESQAVKRNTPWVAVGGLGVVATAVIGFLAIIAFKPPVGPTVVTPVLEAPPVVAIQRDPSPPAALQSTREIVSRCEASVAKIEGKIGRGTGFVAAPGVIATNCHVINEELLVNLKVTFPSATKAAAGPFSVHLLYKDAPRDLVLLKIETTLRPLELAGRDAFQRGEDVITIGNPRGLGGQIELENAVGRGVLSTETSFLGQRWYQLSMSVNPGNSGGPVIDTQGRVVGIVTLKANHEEGHGYCIPVDALATALEKIDGITARQRLQIDRRHTAQSVFQFYRGMAEKFTTASFLLIAALEAKEGQVEAKKVAGQYMEMHREIKQFEATLKGDYATAFRQVVDDPETDDQARQDLEALRRLVDRMSDSLEHVKGVGLEAFKRKHRVAFDEFEPLVDRLCASLDVPPKS